jgi:PAS domain S-box-containing protein
MGNLPSREGALPDHALRDAQDDLFRLALEAAPNGMLMIDLAGNIALVNVQLEQIFGYDRAELLGQPLEMLLPERFRAGHVDLRALFFERLETRVMGEGRDLFGLRKDGTEVPLEIRLNPLTLAGRPYVLSSVSDIGPRKRAEREREVLAACVARAEAAETFRSVFDQSPIAMAILDAGVRYTHINAAWTRILGYERAEFLGKTPLDVTHPDDRDAEEPLLSALVDGSIRSYSREKRYVRRDGTTVHVLLHAAAVNDAISGRHYIGQIQDITQRVQAEEAVRRLQAELTRQAEISATVLKNLPRGAVFLIGRDLCYLSASGPSVRDLVGMTPEEVAGQRVEARVPPQHREEVLGRLRATLDGASMVYEAVRGARTFEVRTAPIYSGESSPVAALFHLYDITERKRQALALEAERERFRALVEDAPVGIFEIDDTGNVLYMNDQWRELTGLSTELARDPANRVAGIHPDDRASLFAAVEEAVRNGRGYKADFRYQFGDGRPRRLSSVAAPVRAANGAVSGFIGITLDVTVQRDAADAMARSLREKETLLKEVHHRVKNNLQVVGSIIGLQANRLTDPEVQRVFDELRGRIHAIALLHERLYRSRDLGAIDLSAYVDGVVGDAARAAGAGPERVTVRAPEAPVTLGIDEAVAVGLVANELVSNAFKHGSRHGVKARIEVELAVERELARLTVSDDGPGFPAGFVAEGRKTLGILLLRRLAKQLGGELRFSSAPTQVVLTFRLGGVKHS